MFSPVAIMRLLALMENVRDFAGNRATRAPRTLRPVQPKQGPTTSYSTYYNFKKAPRKNRTNSRAFKRVLNVRTYEPPKTTVNRILQMTHDILKTTRVITNLAPAQTTASHQRERQTSQTGKGGAHDQDPLHHNHQTCETHYDQRIAPQHGVHNRNL